LYSVFNIKFFLRNIEGHLQHTGLGQPSPKGIVMGLQIVLCVRALMITTGVVPIHKIVKIIELESMFLLKIIPFFDFAIGLGDV
jgi:hypothetical protein